MKVAMVNFGGGPPGPAPSASKSQLRALASALVKQGHEVTVYRRRDAGRGGAGPDPLPGGPRVIDLEAGPPIELEETEVIREAGAFTERLGSALRSDRPDVVHSHGWLSGLAGLLATRRDRLPVAHSFGRPAGKPARSDRPDAMPGWPGTRARVERLIARRATQLIASSPVEQSGLLRGGVARHRVSMVPPGVDCERLCPGGIREPRGAKFLLVLLGSPLRADSAGTVIRALPMIPDTDLVIASDRDDEEAWTSDAADHARQLATRLDVAERVHPRPMRDPERRAALFRSADAVLCLTPSRRPGEGPLEAMACGTPVITTSGADPVEAVVDGVTGLCIDQCAPKFLAHIVLELLANEALRQGMGLAARDRAEHRYSWAHIAIETSRVYQRIASPSPSTVLAGGQSLPVITETEERRFSRLRTGTRTP